MWKNWEKKNEQYCHARMPQPSPSKLKERIQILYIPETNENQKQVQTELAKSEWNRRRLRENKIVVFVRTEVRTD